MLLSSDGIVPGLLERLRAGLEVSGVEPIIDAAVSDASIEHAMALFEGLPVKVDAIVGFGDGKALDVAKYVAFVAKKPFYAVPTSLSIDGFCNPGASPTVSGHRRSHARNACCDTHVMRDPVPITKSSRPDRCPHRFPIAGLSPSRPCSARRWAISM